MKQMGKLITWLAFILGVLLVLGGLYVAIIGQKAETSLQIFGQIIKTTDVGIAFVAIGIITTYLTFKRVLILSAEKPLPEESSMRISAIVHEIQDKTAGIEGATVTLLLSPQPQQELSDAKGNTLFFFPAGLEDRKFKLNAKKDGYKERKPKTVTLQNEMQIFLSLKKEKSSEPSAVNSDQNKNVFVSYAKPDQNAAQKLINNLRQAGFQIFEQLPGMTEIETKHAIKESDCFIVLLSSSALDQRGKIHSEIRYALSVLDEFPLDQIRFIPARIERCQINHYRINALKAVDMFVNWDDAVNKIIKSLRHKKDNLFR